MTSATIGANLSPASRAGSTWFNVPPSTGARPFAQTATYVVLDLATYCLHELGLPDDHLAKYGIAAVIMIIRRSSVENYRRRKR